MVFYLVYKKNFFILYFVILMLLMCLVPRIIPDITPKEYSAIIFSYQNPSFLISLICLSNIFFTYLSLLIPKIELNSIQTFIEIRKPTKRKLLWLSSRISILYFILYLCTKLIALIIYPNEIILFWILIYVALWLIMYNISINSKIQNIYLLIPFILTNIIAIYSFM